MIALRGHGRAYLKNGGSPAWTRKEGKSESGGLNKKGVASYRAANPGSKLKTAVTTKPSKLKKGSKAAKRRKSFCARMTGMRKRQKASNNTGQDRLSKSLRKWNCECHLNQKNKEDTYGPTSQRLQKTGRIPMAVRFMQLMVEL